MSRVMIVAVTKFHATVPVADLPQCLRKGAELRLHLRLIVTLM